MSLREHLKNEVKNWEFIGAPALLQRFVLRNGREYTPTKRIGRKRQAKQCFGNATNIVLRRPVGDGWRYVEGYAINRDQPVMAFHHAWVTIDGTDAMDPTLNAHDYEYFGIALDKPTVVEWLAKSRVYGVFDHGLGLNAELMFAMDPELESDIRAIKPHESWLKAKAVQAAMAVFAAFLVLMPHDLSAQSRVVYGADGRPDRQIHSDQRGNATEYDARTGRVTGRATTGSDGTVTVYGEDGRVREKIAPTDPRARRP